MSISSPEAARITRWRRLFALFAACYLLACVATSVAGWTIGKSPQLITGDAIGYYAWLRSIALDGDIDFSNDYQLLYPPDPIPAEFERLTDAGLVRNKYPPAMAFVQVPGFVAGHVVALASDSPANGASAPYQFGVVLWLQLVIVSGFFALWLALARLGADPRVNSLLIGSGLVATNLVNYVAKETAMAHGIGAALLCFALYAIVRAQESERQARWLAAAGTLLGLALSCRPTNAAFLPFLLPFLLSHIRRSRQNAIALALPITLLVLYHIALTTLLNGRLTISAYDGESFTGGLAGLVGTLFSSQHGLIVYSPWYLLMFVLCMAGLRAPRVRAISLGALASFALLWIANGTWWSWWFGSGFGNRAFVESIPVLIVPVVLWMTERTVPRRSFAALASGMAVLTVLNLYLWLGFLLHRYPPDGLHTVAQAYLWPNQR